ncbi:MAG: TIR domain-containing protein [Nitrospira sp. LK70]|nr:TIR domain-containing protein [Nitrospira sp. LK70]
MPVPKPVFISYHSTDLAFVTRLDSDLLKRGIRASIDTRFAPGKYTHRTIKEQICASDCFIACLSPQYLGDEFSRTRLADHSRIALGKMLYTSPKFQLDVSIFELVSPNGCGTLSPALRLPMLDDSDPTRLRVYVIDHPGGRELGVSVYDNSLKEYDGCYVRYQRPDEGGNSGSPVFDRQLSVFAVHHSAHEARKLNEGVLLRDIQAALSKK